jgi:large conductance mechanosensitive channel
MRSTLQGFKDFLFRGNVIELAVAFVIGTAFAAVVKAFVDNFVNPLVGLVTLSPNLDKAWVLTLGDAKFVFGAIVAALITFAMTAAVVYFVIMIPMNKINERRAAGEKPEPTEVSEDVALLTEIRDLLRAQQQR